ncbi:MAG: OmpA family protein [Bacteroidales bacterium]|jgi:OOP family OmpA-OmpF porin|nr:OmpA family protein [Bacteroidales bacterium]
MKKISLFLTLVLVCGMTLSAQTAEDEVKAMRKNTSHWSIGIKGGVNYYRLSPLATADTDFDSFINQGGYGGSFFVEYAPTPFYGIGLEANYSNLNRTVEGADYLGYNIDAILMSSVNLSNLFGPYRTVSARKVNFFLNAGLGASYYTFQTPADAEYVKGKFSPMAAAGIGVEFNLGKAWTLLCEGQYRYYVKNDLGGVVASKDVDALAVNLGLRWKIGGKKHDHVRNMIPSEYYPVPVQEIIIEDIQNEEMIEERFKTLEEKYNNLENKHNNLNKEYNNLQNQINELEKNGTITIALENVHFDFDSSELTKDSKTLVQQVVNILKDAQWNKITIAGYADNVGTKEVNDRISLKRAETVKKYMVDNGIDGNKLSIASYGKDNPVANNNTQVGRAQNRRVEFVISK